MPLEKGIGFFLSDFLKRIITVLLVSIVAFLVLSILYLALRHYQIEQQPLGVPDFRPEDMVLYIYPILLLFTLAEYKIAKEEYELKDSLSAFGIALGATSIAILTKTFTVFVLFDSIFEFFEPLRIEFLGYNSLGYAWWAWILAIIADDFNYYWHHRYSHTVRLLWAAHIPHHTSNNFNFTVGMRNGWFVTFYKPIFWLWMACIGFEPIMIGTALIINATYQYFLHTKLIGSLGIMGKIFNNPYVHSVHHSSNIEYLDKNHGGILMIWDHLFGTWQSPIKGINPRFGILKNPETYDPIKLNTQEFYDIIKDVKSANSFKEAFMYIFGPPGWSPNNHTLTVKEIQEEYYAGRILEDHLDGYAIVNDINKENEGKMIA